MKKLKDHPKFPKLPEYVVNIEDNYSTIGDAYFGGFKDALQELGNIEILEELDEEKLTEHLFRFMNEGTPREDGKPHYHKTMCKVISEEICSHFGTTPKLEELDEGKVDTIITSFIEEWSLISGSMGVIRDFVGLKKAICSHFGTRKFSKELEEKLERGKVQALNLIDRKVSQEEIEEIIRARGIYSKEFACGLQDKLVVYPKALAKSIVDYINKDN